MFVVCFLRFAAFCVFVLVDVLCFGVCAVVFFVCVCVCTSGGRALTPGQTKSNCRVMFPCLVFLVRFLSVFVVFCCVFVVVL